jgi:hypothetical protein
MRRLAPLLVVFACTACTPIIVERPGPPPPPVGYGPPPAVVYAPPPVVYAPPPGGRRDDDRRDARDRDDRRGRWIDAAIDRAYRDLLERAPDPEGRARFRDLLEHGMSEEQMRARIRESVEYRVTLPDSKTTRAYRAVLGRNPDPSGLQSYRKKIVDQHWSERDVENDLRRSAEYRNRPPSRPAPDSNPPRDRSDRPAPPDHR